MWCSYIYTEVFILVRVLFFDRRAVCIYVWCAFRSRDREFYGAVVLGIGRKILVVRNTVDFFLRVEVLKESYKYNYIVFCYKLRFYEAL